MMKNIFQPQPQVQPQVQPQPQCPQFASHSVNTRILWESADWRTG